MSRSLRAKMLVWFSNNAFVLKFSACSDARIVINEDTDITLYRVQELRRKDIQAFYSKILAVFHFVIRCCMIQTGFANMCKVVNNIFVRTGMVIYIVLHVIFLFLFVHPMRALNHSTEKTNPSGQRCTCLKLPSKVMRNNSRLLLAFSANE